MIYIFQKLSKKRDERHLAEIAVFWLAHYWSCTVHHISTD